MNYIVAVEELGEYNTPTMSFDTTTLWLFDPPVETDSDDANTMGLVAQQAVRDRISDKEPIPVQ